MPYDVSRTALKPLLNAFWSPQGWRTPPAMPDSENLTRAVAAGVMFAKPRGLSHNEWVAAARAGAAAITPAIVGAAFLASLPSRRLDLRSALGSFAIGRALPEHEFAPGGSSRCEVCGIDGARSEEDLNVYSFERFKWGGVRRDDITYAAFDLEQFGRAPHEPLTAEGLRLGRAVLEALRTAPIGTSAASAQALLKEVPGNKAERDVIIGILGLCGILDTGPAHPGYLDSWVPDRRRELPDRHFVDQSYPACWWTSDNGLNTEAIAMFLPQLS